MNKGNLPPEDKKVTPAVNKPQAVPGNLNSSTAPEKQTRAKDDLRLPVLVEFVYTASAMLVILVSFMVVAVSFAMGANVLDTLIRAVVTILVVGGLLILVSWQISAGLLQASIDEQKEDLEKTKKEEQEQAEKLEAAQQEALIATALEAQ